MILAKKILTSPNEVLTSLLLPVEEAGNAIKIFPETESHYEQRNYKPKMLP